MRAIASTHDRARHVGMGRCLRTERAAMLGRILIVGGGIGGLAAAIALQRGPLPVSVVERRPNETPEGTGITISPDGLRALDRLGCADAVRANGKSVPHVIVADGSGRQLGILRPDAGREPTIAISRGQLA